ncbi:VOC family protein [Alkalicoccus urumqiensis]|uniref:Glyoxalase n=1 Tax=Alkalicoccus urumqiensis TaxID=1548213 RepID=A0A2P6ME23_ALKUR|nr:VOC family protein [Alkalicoccus urumqiensis]PRO64531.1 glyoxalase [Alkalicoccus urumqiensis]
MSRMNLITLGVREMGESLRFYRDGLGFQTSAAENEEDIVFFQCPGTKLALHPLRRLTEDIGGVTLSEGGFYGITLAYNAKSKEEVTDMLQRAEDAGGRIVKEAAETEWGGFSGYFSDPDGYFWEVAYGDMWKFDDNDMLIID